MKGKSWWASEETCAERVNILQNIKYEEDKDRCVNLVCCVMQVGGTRCVTSSTANNMKIHVRITLTVEFIRGYIFLFLFYV